MIETVQDRIRRKMEELGLNPNRLAVKAGLDRGTVHKLLTNEQQLPHAKTLTKLSSALNVTEQWLLTGDPASSAPTGPTPSLQGDVTAATIAPPSMRMLPNDVPIFGTAAGSHELGAFLLEGITDYVRRPPALIGAMNIYAIFVEGTSMEPEHNHGDLRFVHPGRPPRLGDSVVVQTARGPADTIEATIGRLAKRTSTTITLAKLNPPAMIDFDISKILAMHKVLTMNELFGM